MKEINIKDTDSNQRLDKFLLKYLNTAPKSFIYKMLRKKNIKINHKKADGNEILSANDNIQIYLSDETINKFTSVKEIDVTNSDIDVLYEDDNIIIVNKPQGLLSQGDANSDDCINSRILSYLYQKGEYDISKESTFTPGISNRLDRNTSGIIICGKNLVACQEINKIFAENLIDKYYAAIVYGEIKEDLILKGYHKKTENNEAIITDEETEGASLCLTNIYPLEYKNGFTYVKIKLITGKSHQIRAHLLKIGHPIVGDKKYFNSANRSITSKYQILHGEEVIIKEAFDNLKYLENKKFVAEKPKAFLDVYHKIFG